MEGVFVFIGVILVIAFLLGNSSSKKGSVVSGLGVMAKHTGELGAGSMLKASAH